MPIGVGLIGYGLAGKTFHAPLIQAAGLGIRAVVTSRAGEVAVDLPGAAVVGEAEGLLGRGDIDLVVIATPNQAHATLAEAALRAGKHVVVDKPFTITSAEADHLIAVAERCDRRLAVYQNRRFDNDFLTLRACLEEGLIGEVMRYQARYDRFVPEVRDRWREWDEPGAGLLYDLGSHLIDQALVLFGWPDWLFADLAIQREGSRVDDGVELLMGVGRTRIALGIAIFAAEPGPRFIVHGRRGSWIKSGIDPQEDQLKAGAGPGSPGWGIEPAGQAAELVTVADGVEKRQRLQSRPGAWETFYQQMAAAIEDRAEVPVPASEARRVIRIIELARRSHAEGRRLDLTSEAGERAGAA